MTDITEGDEIYILDCKFIKCVAQKDFSGEMSLASLEPDWKHETWRVIGKFEEAIENMIDKLKELKKAK